MRKLSAGVLLFVLLVAMASCGETPPPQDNVSLLALGSLIRDVNQDIIAVSATNTRFSGGAWFKVAVFHKGRLAVEVKASLTPTPRSESDRFECTNANQLPQMPDELLQFHGGKMSLDGREARGDRVIISPVFANPVSYTFLVLAFTPGLLSIDLRVGGGDASGKLIKISIMVTTKVLPCYT